jgi:hypothetical protein
VDKSEHTVRLRRPKTSITVCIACNNVSTLVPSNEIDSTTVTSIFAILLCGILVHLAMRQSAIDNLCDTPLRNAIEHFPVIERTHRSVSLPPLQTWTDRYQNCRNYFPSPCEPMQENFPCQETFLRAREQASKTCERTECVTELSQLLLVGEDRPLTQFICSPSCHKYR